MSPAGLVESDGGENGEIMLPRTLGTLLNPLLQHPQHKLHIGGNKVQMRSRSSSMCVCVCVCLLYVCVLITAEWDEESVCE